MLLLFKCSNSLLQLTFSKIFENEVSTDTGLLLEMAILLPFLNNGFTIDYFKRCGKVPDKKEELNI
jgi:hypothetical protein